MPYLHQWDYLFAFGTIFATLDAYNIGANDVANVSTLLSPYRRPASKLSIVLRDIRGLPLLDPSSSLLCSRNFRVCRCRSRRCESRQYYQEWNHRACSYTVALTSFANNFLVVRVWPYSKTIPGFSCWLSL
jgi:hypothetical protein